MPSKTKTIIKETEEVSDIDSRAVLAYRVGQLEKTTTEGLKGLNDKLDALAHNFATKAELEEAKRESELKHIALEESIKDVRREAGRANTAISRVGWLVISVVIISVLIAIGLKAQFGAH